MTTSSLPTCTSELLACAEFVAVDEIPPVSPGQTMPIEEVAQRVTSSTWFVGSVEGGLETNFNGNMVKTCRISFNKVC